MDEVRDITDDQTNDTNDANTEENSVDSHRAPALDRPLKRDPVTGKFIAGTGSRGDLGGRPKGAKDRVSKAMVDLATELVANRGTELFEAMADRDPAQALALVAKIVPPEEMRAVFQEERTGESSNQPIQINIGVVKGPERLPDTRSEASLTAQQRGLGPAPQRIERIAESASTADVVATQEQADEEAAEAERERVRRQAEAIKAHGGLTGRRARTSAPDTLAYPDDHTI